MSGQSASLSIKEARAMQERVQASGSHACNNGGGGGKKMGMSKDSGSTHRKQKEKMEK